MDTVYLDGSHGEGGGQILRTAASLAAMTGTPVEISHIRAGRSKPGLQPQHLAAVTAAARLCNAELHGATVGSSFLRFTPRAAVAPGAHDIDIGTAGAAPLVLQTLLLPLAVANAECNSALTASRVTITGGTHVPHAPTGEYLLGVYLPALTRMGITATAAMPRAGFYPRGGGALRAEIAPAGRLLPLTLCERGKILELTAHVLTALLPDHVGERGREAAERALGKLGFSGQVIQTALPSNGPGAAAVLTVRCEGGHAGFSALGVRGKPMERVVEEAFADFLRWWKTGAACDEHLADQLVLPAALAPGESRWSAPAASPHLRTVLWVAAQFVPIRYAIDARADGFIEVRLTHDISGDAGD